MEKSELARIANQVRKGVLTAVHSASSGHPGGSLGIADVMTYLYFAEMNVDPKNPKMQDRDRFVLSKGHNSPALYAVLAERGFFPKEDLKTFRNKDSYLQGHPDMKNIPGVDMSTGSLGLGISAACGMALSAKISEKSYRVWSVLGDGEIQEGQVWEAAMFAAHYGLNNLAVFVDFNGLQIDGAVADVMNPSPIDEKFRAFGWNSIVIDGHNFDEIAMAVDMAKKSDKPFAIVVKTTKGKGVSFMEDKCEWHGSAPNDEQYEIGMKDLEQLDVCLSK